MLKFLIPRAPWLVFRRDPRRQQNGSKEIKPVGSATKSKASRFTGFIGRYRKRSSGWQIGVLNFAVLSSAIFMINLVVTIWISAYSHDQSFLEGDCEHIKRLNTGLHVLINGLSSILLSGSNYCMQILNAPTRQELDAAHIKGTWIDVGVPSIRNLRHVSRRSRILWALLALSSVPLHLFYNSAVIASQSSNDYQVFLVSEDFLASPSSWDRDCLDYTKESLTQTASTLDLLYPELYEDYGRQSSAQNLGRHEENSIADCDTVEILRQKYLSGALHRLENKECIQAYNGFVQSNNRNLIVVSDDRNISSSSGSVSGGTKVRSIFSSVASNIELGLLDALSFWICVGSTDESPNCSESITQGRLHPDEWRMNDLPVRYCLSEPALQHCRLRFERTVMILVTSLNFVKACLMYYIFFSRINTPILTIGDAVSTFLQAPEPLTMRMCLVSAKAIRKDDYEPGSRQWQNPHYRFKDAISRCRRVAMLVIFLTGLSAGAIPLLVIVQSEAKRENITLAHYFSLGFGTLDPRTLRIWLFPNTLLQNALIANSPQVLISFCYFNYNAVFTAMCVSREWASYARQRKSLRVSRKPRGKQRSTYFLQLPYRFGIPLIVGSSTLHWLASSSIFVVYIDFYDGMGRAWEGRCKAGWVGNCERVVLCGYSPIAITAVTVFGSLMVLALLCIGFVPYTSGIVLVGTNSMAISAACHAKEAELSCPGTPISEKELQWGVVGVGDDGVGHCTFSSEQVEPPRKGYLHA